MAHPGGPPSLPRPPSGPFQSPPAGRQITPEELVVLVTSLTHQLGDSVVLEHDDIKFVMLERKTVQITTQDAPWRMILKVVDAG